MNALRSLTRTTAQALGGEWEVTFAGSEAGTFQRPYCGVVPSTDERAIPHGARHLEIRRGFALAAYPVAGLSAEASRMEAERVKGLLRRAFAQGIDTASFARGRAHPLRLPLWDYGALGLFAPATDANRIGFMRVVEPPAFSAFPDDSGAFVVTCDLRLAWGETIAIPNTRPIVRAVRSEPV